METKNSLNFMNKNNLYFLPAQDEGGQKKTFFLFEYTYDGSLKSDQLQNTDKALSIVQKALAESTRNIVLDTSTNSGRNLLHRVLSLDHEGVEKKIFLASVFRQHYKDIQEYWSVYRLFDQNRDRLPTEEYFVGLFHSARILGGMRPFTALDRLVLRVYILKETKQFEPEEIADILEHPVAKLLLAVTEESAGGTLLCPANTRHIISQMVHSLCRLLQDPLPFEQGEGAFEQPHSRLFKKIKQPKLPPSNVISLVCRDFKAHEEKTGEKKEIEWKRIEGLKELNSKVRKEYPILWRLLTLSKRFFKSLGSGKMPLDSCCIFNHGHDFEWRMLRLLDLMMNIWTEVLAVNYGDPSTLNFINHDIFTKQKSEVMLRRCKEIVQRCRGNLC